MKFVGFIMLVGACVLGGGCSTPAPEKLPPYPEINAFVQAMTILQKNYVDPQSVAGDQLWRNAMSGMAGQLDPYSDYESPQEFKRQQLRRTGEFVGIGVDMFKARGKLPTISRVMPQSPAAQGGVKPGDAIQAIDGHSVAKLNIARCVKLIQGPAGTPVSLTLLRHGDRREVKLIRRKIIRPSIRPEAVKVIEYQKNKLGYIKIDSFSLHTGDEFVRAVAQLQKLQVKALVLDLRHNLGGVVNAAVQVASVLLPPDTAIFAVRTRQQPNAKAVKTVKFRGEICSLPLVVLVNPLTASSAEILTGALQDHGRAVVLGSRTFGKGTILRVVKLVNGGALRYASSYYVTPQGRVIEGHGVKPDVAVKIPGDIWMPLDAQAWRFPGEVAPPGGLRDKVLAQALKILAAKVADL